MKIITKYILKEFMGPLLFGLFTFTSLFLGMLFIDLLHLAEEYHFTLLFTLKLLSLKLPQYITMCVPIAVLLAILLGIGKLTSHSETIAMRAGGLSYSKLAVPILSIAMLVSIGGIFLNEYIVPISLQTFERMKKEATTKQEIGTIYQFNRIFWDNEVQKLIYADIYDPKLREFHNILIQERIKGNLSRTISASVMYWDNNSWYFTQGHIYQYADDSLYPIVVDKGKVDYKLNATPTDIESFNLDPENQSISELNSYIHKFAHGVERQQLLVDLHNKFTIPFASLVFAVLGIPLALRPQRRSNAAGFGLCIIYILVWYGLMGLGNFLGRAEMVPAFLGAWLPNIILTGYGLIVFTRVKS